MRTGSAFIISAMVGAAAFIVGVKGGVNGALSDFPDIGIKFSTSAKDATQWLHGGTTPPQVLDKAIELANDVKNSTTNQGPVVVNIDFSKQTTNYTYRVVDRPGYFPNSSQTNSLQ